MKHFTLFKAWLMLCLFLVVGGGNSWAEVVTFTAGTDKSSTTSITKDGITLTATTFSSDSYYQAYSGTPLKVESTVGNITQIEVTCTASGTSNYGPSKFSKASVGSYSYSGKVGTWTGSATTVSLSTSAQVRMTSVVVTYASIGTPVATPTNLSAGTPTSTGTILTWDAVEHATAYKVEYKVSTAGAWTAVTPNPTTNSCELSGLTPSTTYAWQVTALSTETGYKNGSVQTGSNFTTAAPPSHKAYFYVNGALQNEGGTSFAEGASITFPSDPADIEGKKFQGWTTSQNYSDATTAPSDLCKSATMGGADITYYAVFANQDGKGEESWSLTTDNFNKASNSGSGYTPYNGAHEIDGYTVKSYQVMLQSRKIQFQTANGYLKNTTSFGNISKIVVTGTSDLSVYEASTEISSKPNSGAISSTGSGPFTFAFSGNKGYFFINANGSTPKADDITVYFNNTTYSDYTTSLVKKYDVTFNLQGHGEAVETQAIAEGEKVIEPTAPTATGYTFGGWYKEAECTNAWDFSTDVMGTSAITLYAKWTATSYTIIYNNVDGATHSNPATYTIETATINLADASKEGFIFQGWYENEGLTGDAVTTIAQGSTGNKAFWAKWTEVPANPSTVTFNVGDHGTCETASATEATVGAGVALPEVTVNEGWIFKGWSTENPATAETLVSAGDDGMYHILANTTLYAFYKVMPATPAFSSAAGAIEKGTEVTISCTTEGAAIYYTTNGDEPTAESTAYTEAIVVSEAKTIKAIAILDGEQSEVATVAYTIAQHTAQFSINGVITDANNCTVAKDEAITFPADPAAPEEHVFIGWKKGGEEVTTPQDEVIATVDKATEVMGTEDVTYYAVWAVGSGSGDASTPILTLDFTDSGWKFPAGSTNKVVTETSYINGGKTITVAGSTGEGFYLMQSSGATPTPWALLFGKEGAYLTLPSPSSAVSKMKFYPAVGGTPSNKVTWNVYAGDNVASTLDIPADKTNNDITGLKDDAVEVPIASAYANSQLTVKVTSAANIQISKVEYYGTGISYSDYCTKVVIREISGIAVETAPTTVNYYEGEKFNPEGLKITVNYTEGDPEVVAYAGNEAKFTFSPALDADLTAANTQVTITYKDKTCQQAVNVRTVSINAPTAVEGTYTVKVGEAEAVTADGNTIAAKKGQKIVLASTANTGYRVQSTPFVVKDEDDQTVSVSTAGGQYSFTMPGKNVTITAKFSKLYTLTAADMTNGSIAIKWNDTEVSEAVKGNKIVIDVTPSEHYHLNSLYYMTEGSETQNTIDQTDDIYSFTMEDANTTIYATFEEDEKHDVVFSVNGDESDPVSVYTGEAIVFPAEDPDAPTGMAFMGWAKNAIDGTQETKPETFTSETMGNDDITFFAVFATEDTGSGPSGSITLSKETISGLKTTQWAYDNTGKTLTEDDYTWTFDGTYHGSGLSYLQLGQKSGLIHTPTCPGNITSIVINCKGASGRNLQVYSGDTKVGDAESTPTSDNDVTLTISGSYTQLNIANHDGNGGYSSSNNAININSITVNYGSAPTYSNYCTTIPTLTIETEDGVTTVTGTVSSDEDVATVTTDLAAGTSLDMTGASVSDDVLSRISTTVAGKNILIYAPSSSKSEAVNVVVVDGESRTCEKLVLTDKFAVNIPEEILAGNITYERKTDGDVDVLEAGKYATVYLPYAFPVGNFQVMEFSGVDNGVVSFTYVEETKANVPYIIRPKNVNKASLSFNIVDGAEIVTTTVAEPAEGMSVNDKDTDKMLTRRKVAQGDEGATGFYGTYEELKLYGGDGYYGFASGVFKKANTSAGTKITPFRAYLFVDGTSATRLATFSFEEKDNLVTRVNNVIEALENNEPMYDLNGHAISEPVRGQINIIRGQKVMFK